MSEVKLHSFIWHFLKPYKIAVFIFILFAIASGFWGPCNALLIKYIINILPNISSNNTSPLILPAALIVLNFIIFDNITWRTIGYISYKYQAIIKNNIIRETLDSVLCESHQFFQNNLSGRVSNQILKLADSIEIILHRIAQDMLRGISLLIVSFIAAYSVNPIFFYILFLWHNTVRIRGRKV